MAKRPIVHEIRDGLCTTCGDTEEWLRAQGSGIVVAEGEEQS